jgi:hypothetical protein
LIAHARLIEDGQLARDIIRAVDKPRLFYKLSNGI